MAQPSRLQFVFVIDTRNNRGPDSDNLQTSEAAGRAFPGASPVTTAPLGFEMELARLFHERDIFAGSVSGRSYGIRFKLPFNVTTASTNAETC